MRVRRRRHVHVRRLRRVHSAQRRRASGNRRCHCKIVRAIIGSTPRVAMLSHSSYGSVKDVDTEKVTSALAMAKEKAPEYAIEANCRRMPPWFRASPQVGRPPTPPLQAKQTFWCSPISMRRTSDTSWSSVLPRLKRTAPSCRGSRSDERPVFADAPPNDSSSALSPLPPFRLKSSKRPFSLDEARAPGASDNAPQGRFSCVESRVLVHINLQPQSRSLGKNRCAAFYEVRKRTEVRFLANSSYDHASTTLKLGYDFVGILGYHHLLIRRDNDDFDRRIIVGDEALFAMVAPAVLLLVENDAEGLQTREGKTPHTVAVFAHARGKNDSIYAAISIMYWPRYLRMECAYIS